MIRPTRERVDAVLKARKAPMQSPYTDVDVLAAEVCALREELVVARSSHEDTCGEGHKLRATIARVEALPAEWRDISAGGWLGHCADELEAALKG